MKRWFKIAILLFGTLAQFKAVRAQTLLGIPGLVHVPTADFMRDGTFYVGCSFLPRQTLSYSNYSRDGLVLFSSLTFLPYIEVDLKFTKQLGRSAGQGHTVDRSPSIRFKVLSERRSRPAVVIGLHDVYSTVQDGHARHFGATYVVLGKRFPISKFLIAPSLGYGFDAFKGQNKSLLGLFGGVRIRSVYFRRAALLFEYDSNNVNVGADLYMDRTFRIKCGLLNFQYFSASASMHFDLFDVF